MQLTHSQLHQYDRQISLPEMDLDGQLRLLKAKVLIIGVGGLGCAAAQQLACAGVGYLSLVDPDTIALSNLPRQPLYQLDQVGADKIRVAQQRLQACNPNCHIVGLKQILTSDQLSEQVQHHDLVLDCSDNLASREASNRACVQQQVPLVTGSAIRFEGQLSSFSQAAGSPCYTCFSQLFQQPQPSCSESGTLGPVVSTIGNLQALEAIKILCNIGEPLYGKLLVMDGKRMTFNQFNLKPQANCPVCKAGTPYE